MSDTSFRLGNAAHLVLGTAQFGLGYGIANTGGPVSRGVAAAMLDLAAATGINKLDTAIAYGNAEARLGEIGIDRFAVVTKLHTPPQGCANVAQWVAGEVASSCARLGVYQLHGLLLHRPLQLLDAFGADLYRALVDLRTRGVIVKLGISIYDPDELTQLVGRFHFDLVQAPFNLIDRRLQTSGWLPRLKDAGVEVHCRSAFLQGLLLMSLDTRPYKFAPWNMLWQRWQAWLRERNASALQVSLSFPLAQPEIDGVVVGADNLEQLRQIIEAASQPVTGDWPDLACEDLRLVNPTRWTTL